MLPGPRGLDNYANGNFPGKAVPALLCMRPLSPPAPTLHTSPRLWAWTWPLRLPLTYGLNIPPPPAETVPESLDTKWEWGPRPVSDKPWGWVSGGVVPPPTTAGDVLPGLTF